MPSAIARYTRKIGPVVRRYLPIIAWLPAYQRADLRSDLMAGAISWAVMVPVAMAYAQMAGVPPQAGLYASLASLIAYALFGTSRHQRVLASSTMAVMSAPPWWRRWRPAIWQPMPPYRLRWRSPLAYY